jgi:hypothetical protein
MGSFLISATGNCQSAPRAGHGLHGARNRGENLAAFDVVLAAEAFETMRVVVKMDVCRALPFAQLALAGWAERAGVTASAKIVGLKQQVSLLARFTVTASSHLQRAVSSASEPFHRFFTGACGACNTRLAGVFSQSVIRPPPPAGREKPVQVG